MPLSQMIVHLIIVLLVEVNFIQLFSNFSDLYHSFLQPFCSFSCISFHLHNDFSRKRLQNLIKLDCFKYPNRCFSINWKRKISSIEDHYVFPNPLFLTFWTNDEFLSWVRHKTILCNKLLVFQNDYFSITIYSSSLWVDMAF